MQKICYCFKKNYFTFIVSLLLLCSSFSLKLASAQCDWNCDNGDCIDGDLLCDGVAQCTDGSDEIVENCFSNATCPEYAFRCSYGACLAGIVKCNGKQDCADNSDELPLLCEKNRNLVRQTLRGRCSEFELQCESGDCIDDSLMCDGQQHCQDGTDERLETCSHFLCASFAFRCAYGACVDGKAMCNGTAECHDGSDEASALCGTPRQRTTSTSVTGRPVIPTRQTPRPTRPTTTSTTITTKRPYSNGAQCVIPYDRENVIIIEHLTKKRLQAGTAVSVNSLLGFECEHGYSRVGVSLIACLNTGWSDFLPTCTKYCDASMVTYGVSTTVICYFANARVPCKQIRPGTIAEIGCATGFHHESSVSNVFRKSLSCGDSFQWNYQKTPCQMRCGYVQPPSTPFTKHGTPVEITEVPWHVNIYSRHKENKYERICGGSIISPRIVLSAAHCFWDEANSEVYEKSYYRVAAGKYFPEYDSPNENSKTSTVQKSALDEIYVEGYTGNNNYVSDIAILRLQQHFEFSDAISPICVTFHDRGQAAVGDDLTGFIVGWGPDEQNNGRGDILQKVDMLTRSYYSCVNNLRNRGVNYDLPNDKFCVTRATSRGDICRGDSGGAFVTKEIYNNQTRYRLVGVISHAPLSLQDCGRDGLVALTNVEYFQRIITRYTEADIDRVPPFQG